MRYSDSRLKSLWLSAAVALVAAALLVGYLHQRFMREQRRQTSLILQQVCERTATVLATRMRQLFDAALLETLEAVDHVASAEFDLVPVVSIFNPGLERHRYVERFFLWSRRAPTQYLDQVLFYQSSRDEGSLDIVVRGAKGEPLGGFVSDPAQGREIMDAALAVSRSKRGFGVFHRTFDGVPYQIVIHNHWDHVTRDRLYGVTGYAVNLLAVRQRIFTELLQAELAVIVPADAQSQQLAFTVFDEQQKLIYGRTVPATHSATAWIDLLFYPMNAPKSWLSAQPARPRWQLVVSASEAATANLESYGLLVAIMCLILMALLCAIGIDRQWARLSKMHSDLCRMYSDFVANVSHELKTPLSILAAASETLRLGRVRSPEKVNDYADIIHYQTSRLSDLVTQILRFSRNENGAKVYRFQKLELGQLVKTSVEGFDVGVKAGQVGVKAGQVTLQYEGPPHDVFVHGDRGAIEEVLDCLLDNAVKYGNGSHRVSVHVECDSGQAILSVRDEGIGIDPGDLSRIFEKFYRGSHDGHSKPGFGLGLAIVQDVLVAHQGRITVNSEPGRGSEFRIILPAA